VFYLAKYVHGYSFKGELEVSNDGTLKITETTKEDIKVYDLMLVLKQFSGRTVSIQIKEDNEPEPLDE
jgi:predicted Ser/Thr protein kinase